jgi:hypothetical protein
MDQDIPQIEEHLLIDADYCPLCRLQNSPVPNRFIDPVCDVLCRVGVFLGYIADHAQ